MRFNFSTITTFSVISMLFFSQVFAQNSSVLQLKSGDYMLTNNISEIKSSDLKVAQYEDHFYVYTHFDQIPTNVQKAKLRAIGVEVLDYVPKNTFFTKIAMGTNLSSLKEYHIDGIYLVLPEFKMSYAVSQANYPAHALKGKRVQLIVQNHSEASAEVMDAYYSKLGARIVSHYSFSQLTTVDISIDKCKN